MCGITAYCGKDNALPFLLRGLEKLEYRGYDSSGISLLHEGKIMTAKKTGKIKKFRRCDRTPSILWNKWDCAHSLGNAW